METGFGCFMKTNHRKCRGSHTGFCGRILGVLFFFAFRFHFGGGFWFESPWSLVGTFLIAVYLNDMYTLDMERMEWGQVFTSGTAPAARSRHTMTDMPNGKDLLMFGGGDDSRVYHDLYVFDTETATWSRPAVTGTPAPGRWGHTTVRIGDQIFVWGGHDGKKMLSDLYVLNVAQRPFVWTQVQPANPSIATARAGHTAVAWGKYMVVYGGGDGTSILTDLFFLDTEESAWMTPKRPLGMSPSSRCAHAAAVLPGAANTMLIFGGSDSNQRFRDVQTIDLSLTLTAPSGALARKASAGSNNSTSNVSAGGDGPSASSPLKEGSVNGRKESNGSANNNNNNNNGGGGGGGNGNGNGRRRAKNRGSRSPSFNNAGTGKISVGSFLSSIGLNSYVDAFRAQEVDMEAMQLLTDADLMSMGITKLGPRRKILAGVAELRKTDDGTASTQSTPGVNAVMSRSSDAGSQGSNGSATNTPASGSGVSYRAGLGVLGGMSEATGVEVSLGTMQQTMQHLMQAVERLTGLMQNANQATLFPYASSPYTIPPAYLREQHDVVAHAAAAVAANKQFPTPPLYTSQSTLAARYTAAAQAAAYARANYNAAAVMSHGGSSPVPRESPRPAGVESRDKSPALTTKEAASVFSGGRGSVSSRPEPRKRLSNGSNGSSGATATVTHSNPPVLVADEVRPSRPLKALP